MLFVIFVLVLILGIVSIVVYNNTNVDEWCLTTGVALIATGVVAIVISLFCIGDAHIGNDGYVAAHQERYESLVYQYENDLYDNDNDLGKKELMKEIQDWNEDLARYQHIQDDFWIGIYIPNIYDQFEFIELNQE